MTHIADETPQFLITLDVLLSQVGAADDYGQKIVEVVRDAPGELTDRFHLLRLEELLACLFELLLGFTLLGQVAGDFCEPDDFTLVITVRVDDNASPEARAVFTHA